MAKYLMENSIFVRIENIGDRFQPPSDFNNAITGLFLDYDCTGANDMLLRQGEIGYLSLHENWLIYTRQELDAFSEKATQFQMGVDVEMTLIDLNSTELNFYEVFNNGQHIGGKLKIRKFRKVVPINGSIELTPSIRNGRPKYEMRRLLNDITIRSTIAVIGEDLSNETAILKLITDRKPGKNRELSWSIYSYHMFLAIREHFQFK